MDDATNSLPLSQMALDRLSAALDRLEGVLTRPLPQIPAADAVDGEEMQQIREDFARLDDATRVVETRLSGIIERLRIVLGD